MALSVVIPTLDEEARIGAALGELARQRGVAEVVVVDGGSTDRTVAIARTFEGVRVIAAPRGRGRQMNTGARATSADVLLFLHADVCLCADAARWVEVALSDAAVVAGAFRTRTVADGRRRWLGPLLRVADVRSRFTGLPYGDQALFVRRSAFEAVGGFPEIPIMEDVELACRLRAVGSIRTVPACVRVSGRRFVARPVHSLVAMNVLPALYRWGVAPDALAAWYGGPR